MCTLPPSTSIRMSHVEKSSQWHKLEVKKSLGLKTHQWDNLAALKRGCKNHNYQTHHSYWSLPPLVYTLSVLCLQLIYPGAWCSRFLHNINIHLSDYNGITLQKTAEQSSVTTVTIKDLTLMGFATDVAAHINLYRAMGSTGTQCTSGQKH